MSKNPKDIHSKTNYSANNGLLPNPPVVNPSVYGLPIPQQPYSMYPQFGMPQYYYQPMPVPYAPYQQTPSYAIPSNDSKPALIPTPPTIGPIPLQTSKFIKNPVFPVKQANPKTPVASTSWSSANKNPSSTENSNNLPSVQATNDKNDIIDLDTHKLRLTSKNRKEGWQRYLVDKDRTLVQKILIETEEFDSQYKNFEREFIKMTQATSSLGDDTLNTYNSMWSQWKTNLLSRREQMLKLQEKTLDKLYAKVCQNFPLFLADFRNTSLSSPSQKSNGPVKVNEKPEVKSFSSKDSISPTNVNSNGGLLPLPVQTVDGDQPAKNKSEPISNKQSETKPDAPQSETSNQANKSIQVANALRKQEHINLKMKNFFSNTELIKASNNFSFLRSQMSFVQEFIQYRDNPKWRRSKGANPVAQSSISTPTSGVGDNKALLATPSSMPTNISNNKNNPKPNSMSINNNPGKNPNSFPSVGKPNNNANNNTANNKTANQKANSVQVKNTPENKNKNPSQPTPMNNKANNPSYNPANSNNQKGNLGQVKSIPESHHKINKQLTPTNQKSNDSHSVPTKTQQSQSIEGSTDNRNLNVCGMTNSSRKISQSEQSLSITIKVSKDRKQRSNEEANDNFNSNLVTPVRSGTNVPEPTKNKYSTERSNNISIPLQKETVSVQTTTQKKRNSYSTNNNNNIICVQQKQTSNSPNVQSSNFSSTYYNQTERSKFSDLGSQNVARSNFDEMSSYSQPLIEHKTSFSSKDINSFLEQERHNLKGKFTYTDPSFFTVSRKYTEEPLYIKDLLDLPGRSYRPQNIVFIVRGLPGSGKSYLSKLIKEREEAATPSSKCRLLSIDDYFFVEKERDLTYGLLDKPFHSSVFPQTELVYEYDPARENEYKFNLFKAFRKTLSSGYFDFVIVDSVNASINDVRHFYACAIENNFIPYVIEMEAIVRRILDDCILGEEIVAYCYKHNRHGRSLSEIRTLYDQWELLPVDYLRVDAFSIVAGHRANTDAQPSSPLATNSSRLFAGDEDERIEHINRIINQNQSMSSRFDDHSVGDIFNKRSSIDHHRVRRPIDEENHAKVEDIGSKQLDQNRTDLYGSHSDIKRSRYDDYELMDRHYPQPKPPVMPGTSAAVVGSSSSRSSFPFSHPHERVHHSQQQYQSLITGGDPSPHHHRSHSQYHRQLDDSRDGNSGSSRRRIKEPMPPIYSNSHYY